MVETRKGQVFRDWHVILHAHGTKISKFGKNFAEWKRQKSIGIRTSPLRYGRRQHYPLGHRTPPSRTTCFGGKSARFSVVYKDFDFLIRNWTNCPPVVDKNWTNCPPVVDNNRTNCPPVADKNYFRQKLKTKRVTWFLREIGQNAQK